MYVIRHISNKCSSSERLNSDTPIYILTKQMSEKIKCPERDSNPRHPDLMEGALTTELPRQPQWSESNICYKGNIDYQTFAPRPLQTGNYFWRSSRRMLIGPRCYRPLQMYVIRHISNKCSSSERKTLICLSIY